MKEKLEERKERIVQGGRGRNIWQRKDPLDISRKIHQVIFGSSSSGTG